MRKQKENVDAMLTASEELLVASLRNGDVITRWENGTLLILLKRALANDAKKVAERLCKRIGEELVQVGELTLTTNLHNRGHRGRTRGSERV